MAEIKYFSSDNNGPFVRPLNYSFPAGLTRFSNSANYLVAAGGGGGAQNASGGGGAGGLLISSATLQLGTTYTITVGAGGSASVTLAEGDNGSNSSISGKVKSESPSLS